MLKITEIKFTPKTPRALSSAQRTSRKLRKAYLRRLRSKEYLRLKSIVPTVASKAKVDKVTVVEEAIRYIDHLHEVLAKKLQQIGYAPQGTDQAAMFNMVKMMASGQMTSSLPAQMANLPFNIRPCTSPICHAAKKDSRRKS